MKIKIIVLLQLMDWLMCKFTIVAEVHVAVEHILKRKRSMNKTDRQTNQINSGFTSHTFILILKPANPLRGGVKKSGTVIKQ